MAAGCSAPYWRCELDYVRATQVAASIGQGMAVLFAFLGLFFNPFLIFIGLFVWLGAAQEASMVQMRSALAGIPVRRAMITEFRTLRPDDTLDQAVEHIRSGFQQDFPVVEDGRLVGVLTRSDLTAALGRHGPGARVREIMRRDFVTVDPRDMLQTAFARLQDCDCHTLPVVRDGRLMGLVTADNLAEVLMIQEALREAPYAPSPGPGRRPAFARASPATHRGDFLRRAPPGRHDLNRVASLWWSTRPQPGRS